MQRAMSARALVLDLAVRLVDGGRTPKIADWKIHFEPRLFALQPPASQQTQ